MGAVRSSQTRRNAAPSSAEVAVDLASMGATTADIPEDVLIFLPPTADVFRWTCLAIGATLGAAAISSLGACGFVYMLFVLIPQSLAPSEKNRIATYLCSGGWGLTAVATLLVLVLNKLDDRITGTGSIWSNWFFRAFVEACYTSLSPLTLTMLFALFFEVFKQGSAIPGFLVAFGVVTCCAGTTYIVIFRGVLQVRRTKIFSAAKRARQIVASEGENLPVLEVKTSVWRDYVKAHKISFSKALPSFFVYVVVLLYVFGIFMLYRAVDSTLGKTCVYLLGLMVKTVGNKVQLFLIMQKQKRADGNEGNQDITIYLYEYATALLCRLMLTSIPDPSTALLLSVLNAVAEMMVRVWFYVNFMSHGAREGQARVKMSKYKRAEYWNWGNVRVVDASNDMMVEYVTSFVAAAVLYWLPETGAFRVVQDSTQAGVDGGALLLLVAFQTVPEIVIDSFMCALETRGGLIGQYRDYWGKFTFLSLLSKLFITVSITAFCLATSII